MVRSKKILIVEDDAATAHAYRGCLERAGYAVHVAVDGEAGLESIQRSAPDGVLLDLMLPKMNGIELLKSIRTFHHLARIPVIVYTNAFVPKLVEEASAAGATQVFSKSSLTPQMLVIVLSAIVRPD
jgi:CheY-like chemotaxis protein